MITHPAGLAAGFALAANAFMIPSTTSLQGEGLAKSIEQLTQPSTRLVKLECSGCSVPEGIEIEGDNSLVLNFALSDDHKSLLLNGGNIYPGLPSAFTPVTQTSTDTTFEALQNNPEEVSSNSRWLSFGSTLRHIEAADGTDSQLVDMSFQITAIGDETVHVDNLDIRLLQAEDGTLGIGDIIQVSPANAPHIPTIEDGEALFEIKPIDTITPIEAKPHGCSSGMPDVLCRFRDMMAAHLESLREKAHNHLELLKSHRKPCPGKLRKPTTKIGIDKFLPQQEGKPHSGPHNGPHRHNHMHHRAHRFMMGLRRVLFGFIIPVMIGIAAGMTASLVGMVFGTLIAFLWIKFVRKGKKGNASGRVRLAEEECFVAKVDEEDVPEEKRVLMADVEEGEAPPVYVEKQ